MQGFVAGTFVRFISIPLFSVFIFLITSLSWPLFPGLPPPPPSVAALTLLAGLYECLVFRARSSSRGLRFPPVIHSLLLFLHLQLRFFLIALDFPNLLFFRPASLLSLPPRLVSPLSVIKQSLEPRCIAAARGSALACLNHIP